MAKILMLLDKEFPADDRVEKEIHTLLAEGHEVRLLALTYHKDKEFEIIRNIAVYRFFGSKFLYKLSALAFTFPLFHAIVRQKMCKFVKRFRPDVLHVHDMVIAPAVLDISKKHKIPMVLDLHENRPAIMQLYAHVSRFPGKYLINLKKWRKAQIKLEKEADRLILITDEAKKYAVDQEGIDPFKIFVVPNTVKKEFGKNFSLSYEIESRFKDKFCILYFGDTALRRGTDTIVEAIHLLKEDIKNIHAIIVGTGSEDDKLLAQARSLDVEDRVSFEGWQDVRWLNAYANSAAIGICPFRRNLHHDTTFANKLFQFMGLGLPVIVSDCPSQVKIIQDNACGLVFRADDAADLAEKIKHLYLDEILRKKLGTNGKKSIEQTLNWDETAKSLTDLYKSF
ncbi:MAG: glycosyltransferase family 4 protein [Cyclobacteriaceae bacterium]|nr:glycosyltransferase family 4 protein [Cyclobacteriaceae bacterium]